MCFLKCIKNVRIPHKHFRYWFDLHFVLLLTVFTLSRPLRKWLISTWISCEVEVMLDRNMTCRIQVRSWNPYGSSGEWNKCETEVRRSSKKHLISVISISTGRRRISDYTCLRIKINGLFLFKFFRLHVGLLPTPGIIRYVLRVSS